MSPTALSVAPIWWGELTSASQLKIDLTGYGPNVTHALDNQTTNGTSVVITLTDGTTMTFDHITHLTSSNFS